MFEIGDQYRDPWDEHIGTIVKKKDGYVWVSWTFDDGDLIIIKYLEAEFDDDVKRIPYSKLANVNKIWKDLCLK